MRRYSVLMHGGTAYDAARTCSGVWRAPLALDGLTTSFQTCPVSLLGTTRGRQHGVTAGVGCRFWCANRGTSPSLQGLPRGGGGGLPRCWAKCSPQRLHNARTKDSTTTHSSETSGRWCRYERRTHACVCLPSPTHASVTFSRTHRSLATQHAAHAVANLLVKLQRAHTLLALLSTSKGPLPIKQVLHECAEMAVQGDAHAFVR